MNEVMDGHGDGDILTFPIAADATSKGPTRLQ